MSKKITNRDIHDLFIEYFEGEKKFTPSEMRMNGIKITQLRKNVKQYIEDNNIDTDLTVNEIIIDTIEYSNLINLNFRSTASLGFDVLPKSINYWRKRRQLMAEQEANDTSPNQNNVTTQSSQNEHDINKQVINKSNNPKWMNNDEW